MSGSATTSVAENCVLNEAKYVKKEGQVYAARQTMLLRGLFLLALAGGGWFWVSRRGATADEVGLRRTSAVPARARPALPGASVAVVFAPPPLTEAELVMAAAASAAAAAAAAAAGGPAHSEEEVPPPSWNASAPDTCAGFFGNGYNPPVPLHAQLACSIHTSLNAHFCSAVAAVLHPSRVGMSRGGEVMANVMGRTEEAELPKWDVGAVELAVDGVAAFGEVGAAAAAAAAPPPPTGEPLKAESVNAATSRMADTDAMKAEMLKATRTVKGPQRCASRITDPVFAVTRMEYANLFHTSTDWYNVWSVARSLGHELVGGDVLAAVTARGKAQLPLTTVFSPFTSSSKFPIHILFLDGHNAGPMDEGWLGLFASITYVKHFEGPACFDNIIFAPFG